MALLIVVLVVVAVLVWKHTQWTVAPWPKGALTPPKYQGHRGYWKEGAVENTLASFKAAHKRGLLMVEMDVRLSKDGVVVVHHDEDLQRLEKNSHKVADLTWAELKNFGLCTLEEVLQNPEVPRLLNVELKTGRAFEDSLEKAVVEVVRKNRAQDRVLFSSFNPLALRRLGKLLPEVPRALLASREEDPSNKFYLKHLLFAPYVGANLLHLDHKYVSVEELKKWNRRKIPVAFWTVNDATKANNLLEHGALSIITDTLK